jgi:hypothetical protein
MAGRIDPARQKRSLIRARLSDGQKEVNGDHELALGE